MEIKIQNLGTLEIIKLLTHHSVKSVLFVGSQLPVDGSGYEYLPPDRVGFGDPLPTRPLKITNSYATPTALQIQSLQPQPQPQPQFTQSYSSSGYIH